MDTPTTHPEETAIVNKVVPAALKYFTEGGWEDTDLAPLKSSETIQDIWDHLYNLACIRGGIKGYGSEGISEIHSEYMYDICVLSGLHGAFDDV
jgi:hypothetical protein